MDLGDMPITLIVKAPNQRIEDQNIECTLGWTIRKLKEHLQHVYPNKPKHNQQKLIYSGKLLEDNLTLKQVLREDNASHTVHLVCSTLHDLIEDNHNVDKSLSQNSVHSSSSSETPLSDDGLRYRGTSPPQNITGPPTSMSNMYTNHPHNYMQHMYSQMPQMYSQMYGAMPQMYGGAMPQMYGGAVPQMYGGMMPNMYNQIPQSSTYSQAEYNVAMQQMYSQYMSQYMQYYSNSVGMTPPPTPTTPIVQEEPINRNVINNGNNRPANQNVRMNAQGGIVDDDDEENEHRDWLDCIYILFRCLVLISIVYFYSTVARSAAVFLVFFLIYILQKGWLLIRQRERINQVNREVPVNNNDNIQNNDTDNPPAQDNNQEASDAQDGGENEDSTEVPQAPPAVPPVPGVLATVWCFVTTFFSSLIPENPVAVNRN